MHQILVLDDNEEINQLMSVGLAHTFKVFATTESDKAYEFAINQSPSAIILDVQLKNGANGLELCQRLRQNALTRHIPIIVMSGSVEVDLRALAIEIGADDFIQKPLEMSEIELRLKARIRRFEDVLPKRNKIGNLMLVPERHEIEIHGKFYRLSPTEFQILRVFVLNPNRSISRLELLSSIWQEAPINNRTVDVHVSTLRRKLAGFDFKIDSIYGSGYILRQANETL